jgi:hypothetical protein
VKIGQKGSVPSAHELLIFRLSSLLVMSTKWGQWNNTWLWLGGYHKRSNGFHVAFSASFLVSLQGRLEWSTRPNLGSCQELLSRGPLCKSAWNHSANPHEHYANPHENHCIMEVAGYSPILACTSFTSKSKLKTPLLLTLHLNFNCACDSNFMYLLQRVLLNILLSHRWYCKLWCKSWTI